ncbi:MAG: type III pantothenate kinase [Nitrospinota bacterium]
MNEYLLAIDVGNTNIVIGLYDETNLLASLRSSTNSKMTADEFELFIKSSLTMKGFDPGLVSNIAIASVVPSALPALKKFSVQLTGKPPLLIAPGIKTGLSINYENPHDVGSDRIANAVAALAKYPPPILVIDFGTAITIDVLNESGEYLGGAIAPGINLSINSLCTKTAKLPNIDFAKPPSVIGRNSVHSMQAGIFFGYLDLVDGLVARIRKLFKQPPTIVATGGEANIFAQSSSSIERVDDNLTLDGIKIIFERNR